MAQALRQQIASQFKSLSLENDKELQYTIAFAAKVCKTPVSLITILDEDTQWLKVRKGIDIEQTPLELSFCKFAIKHEGLLTVNDTLLDHRFRDHPNVVSNLKFRFYAGMPLVTREGLTIGTFCVLDYKPHNLNAEQKAMLKLLSKHALSVMEQKRSVDRIEKVYNELNKEREAKVNVEIKLTAMFESLTDEYFLIGKNGELIDFNRAAYDTVLKNNGRKLSYGQLFTEVLTDAYKKGFELHYQNALKGKRAQFEVQSDYAEKGKIWWDCIIAPVTNNDNQIIGVSYVVRNINVRKLAEEKIIEQNHVLHRIAEIQSHDYRGPVATILGLMNLIENDNYTASEEYLKMMKNAVDNLDKKINEVVTNVELMRHK